jgi:hypothetical protein
VLAAGVKSGAKVTDVLRETAKKYGITTITARWYLKSISVKPKRKGKRMGRPPGSRNGSSDLAKVVEKLAAKTMEASRLVPLAEASLSGVGTAPSDR